MLQKYSNPLKIASLIVGLAGMLLHNELQKRETRELVEEVLAEHEAKKATSTEH